MLSPPPPVGFRFGNFGRLAKKSASNQILSNSAVHSTLNKFQFCQNQFNTGPICKPSRTQFTPNSNCVGDMQICARKNRRVRLSKHHRKVRMTLEIEIELERQTNELAGARSSCSAHEHGGMGTQHASFHVCVFCVFVVTRNPRQDFILWLIAEWISIQHQAYGSISLAPIDCCLVFFSAHILYLAHV